MISKGVGGFLKLGIFLIFKVFFNWPVATKVASIAFLDHKSRLTGHFSLGINASFNDFLLVIKVLIFFIEFSLYQWSETIPEITNE